MPTDSPLIDSRNSLTETSSPLAVRHHIVISGTGRAGTTFLVQLLTHLGLDTGFADPHAQIYANCDAGMEHDLRSPSAPYIVKAPELSHSLGPYLESAGTSVVIDHLFIPVRDLHEAAESRRHVTQRTDAALYPAGIPGGLWMTRQPEQQEHVLLDMLYQLSLTAAKWEIPVSLLHFPRTVLDPVYLYRKLTPALDGIGYEKFLAGFRQIARPEMVHRFSPQ